MIQENKQLLLKDLCARLPYGVKILHDGWDFDKDCDYSTIETLIGIDDRFIHTLWRDKKDKHSIVEPLSIIDYKPFLRPMLSMTEEEETTFEQLIKDIHYKSRPSTALRLVDWLDKNMFDHRGLIPLGLAIEVTEENNPYK